MNAQRKILKSLTGIALIALAAMLFKGCAASVGFDHVSYVRSLLDASYKAEFADYSEITGTEKVAAETQYYDNIELVSNAICDSLGVQVSDEHRAEITAIVEKLFKSASYEVLGDAAQADSDYFVELKISPIMNFSDIENAFNDFTAQLTERLNAPELEGASVADVNEMFIDGVVDVFETKTKEIIYGEEKTLSIPVIYNLDTQKWYVPDENLKVIFDTIVAM